MPPQAPRRLAGSVPLPPLAALVLAALAATPAVAHHHEETDPRFTTSRTSPIQLPLPDEKDAFFFVVFGDRTGGPREGVQVLSQAVVDTNALAPDLVMTVGDLVQGYNDTSEWLGEMREFKGIMEKLDCPWFPVAGNHDIYWRGKGPKPKGEHEASYEMHFGPLWYAFEHKRSWFVALYSDEGNPETGEKNFDKPDCQKMSTEQFAWLESVLARAKDAENVFLFLHHPRWLSRYGDDWQRVHALLASAGNVRAVFGGHIHRLRYDGKRDGVEYFALATVGGDQNGYAPKAGYLHQFHVVTVRGREIAVASVPVGEVQDARTITGAISDDVEKLARNLKPAFAASAGFAPDRSLDAAFELEIQNPTSRTIEVEAAGSSDDARWTFEPDHEHAKLESGAKRTFRVRARRAANLLDEAFRAPEIVVRVDYLGDGLRVPIPEKRFALPIDLATLPEPAKATNESALALDGDDDAVRVDSAALALPDGPFTIEGWVNARSFPKRCGFVNKTESAEFGLFVGEGKPSFMVHVDGRYQSAEGAAGSLVAHRWTHLAGVFDGAEVRLYVDGKLTAKRAASGKRKTNTLPLMLGADVTSAGTPDSFLPGSIDELRVSKVARYAGESFTPSRRHESDADTLLLLHFDELVGPWAFDSSPRKRPATVLGRAKLATAE